MHRHSQIPYCSRASAAVRRLHRKSRRASFFHNLAGSEGLLIILAIRAQCALSPRCLFGRKKSSPAIIGIRESALAESLIEFAPAITGGRRLVAALVAEEQSEPLQAVGLLRVGSARRCVQQSFHPCDLVIEIRELLRIGLSPLRQPVDLQCLVVLLQPRLLSLHSRQAIEKALHATEHFVFFTSQDVSPLLSRSRRQDGYGIPFPCRCYDSL